MATQAPIISVREMQNAHFKEEDEGFQLPDENTVWPSELWHCMRNKYYARMGLPRGPAPHGIFEAGRQAEYTLYMRLREHFGGIFVLKAVHIRVGPELEPRLLDVAISGKTDPLVLGENLVPRLVYESKSKGTVYQDDDPSPQYLRQLMTYIFAIRPKEGGRLWMVERDNYDSQAEHVVPFDQAVWDSIVDWTVTFIWYVRNKKVPPPMPMMESWECRYCPFATQCLKDGPADVVKAVWKKARRTDIPQ